MWSFVKNRKQDHVGIGPLEYQGSAVTDSLSKANVLAKYFSLAFTNEDTANVPVLEGDPLPKISLIHIHADGVAQLLSPLCDSLTQRSHKWDSLTQRSHKWDSLTQWSHKWNSLTQWSHKWDSLTQWSHK